MHGAVPTFAGHWWQRLMVRLVAVALVPVLVLGLFAGGSVRTARGYDAQAERVSALADRMVKMVSLRFAVTREATAVLPVVQSQLFGIPLGLASAWLGLDLATEVPAAQQAVDALVPLLAADPAFTAAYERVLAARASLNSPANDLNTQVAAYQAAADASRGAPLEELAKLRTAAAGLRDGDELRRRIEVLASTYQVSEALMDETRATFDTLFTGGVEHDAARLRLAVFAARRDAALATTAELVGAAPGHDRQTETARAFAVAAASPELAAFAATAEEMLAPTVDHPLVAPAPLSASTKAAPTFKAALVAEQVVLHVVEAAGDDVGAAAAVVRTASAREVRRVVAVASLTFVVCIGGLVALARSVGGPLANLESRALAVVTGTAADEPLPLRGPREVRVVTQAHNELVANLVTIERQAGALARGALDDPALAEPASGPLGRSLQQTVDRLSEAMTSQASLQEQLAYDATHDPLTGLVNRAAALDAVANALARAQAADREAGVLFIDLDGFKAVNDRHGHGVGDAVLRVAAERIAAIARDTDVVARLGGDEFLVIAAPVAGLAEARAVGERIVASVAEPIALGDLRLEIGASVGVATSGRADAVDTLVHEADVAVYQAKAKGRGRVEVAGWPTSDTTAVPAGAAAPPAG